MSSSFGPTNKANHYTKHLAGICVIGVGGAGGNAINNMISRSMSGVEFITINSDAQHLSTTLTPNQIQIGSNITRGLGCGANPDAGRAAALESQDQIMETIGDAHMAFITAGMGGGTGTGAASVVAGLCQQMDILTVGVVTLPFRFEGRHRMRLAEEGVANLQTAVDTMIIIPNQNLFKLVTPETPLIDSFALADDVLLGKWTCFLKCGNSCGGIIHVALFMWHSSPLHSTSTHSISTQSPLNVNSHQLTPTHKHFLLSFHH